MVEVRRDADIFYDFENDDSFESALIDRGSFEQTYFSDRSEPPGGDGILPTLWKTNGS